MAFLILTMDKLGTEHIRAQFRAQHYAFLEERAASLVASGGLQDDSGETFIGAAILLDCDTRAEAEAFVAADPFTTADLFESVNIVRWKKAFLNGARATD
ncbi:YciI family protein [Novosphingobium colocasiae]|uniref:YCII-related domain-containing protein n=1 Tax=Novosphingobium colocasiae TaxID=1256513 RepID=A0A918PK71_9SPHN|nr:YciI family protein [Novosphingobium colocasiae]GGZ11137.1 hypothetical protein GCM10011614_27580 [Novosphingobium colocasiae]